MAEKSRAIWEKLQGSRSIALLDPGSPEECLRAYRLLDPLGIVLEIACRREHALPGIEAVLQAHPGALLLAGTVLTREQAEGAVALGVAGVVSPDYLPGVVEACVEADVMCVPGGMADCGKQLVFKAERYRCTLEELRRDRPWQWVYKIFPATADEGSLGRSVAAWKGVYPGIRFLYTGGVTPRHVGRLARQDPEGIFCGSALAHHLDDPPRARQDAERWLREVAGAGPIPAPLRPRAPGGGARGVVTFGEIMLRLSPAAGSRLRGAGSFEATHGGAEANVAAALAQWGIPSRYVTVLPEHDLAESALDRLRGLGVDTSAVLRRGDRMGIYFLEPGASQRPSRVIYDRAGSSLAGIGPGEVDWEGVLQGAAWFHCSGITPALSEGAAAVVEEAVRAAKALGLTVSFDLNYRATLWPRERARETLTPLVEEVDVLLGNRDQLAGFLGGWKGEGDAPDREGAGGAEGCEALGRQLVERFGLRLAAMSVRGGAPASGATWQAFLHDGRGFYPSASYALDVVDGVGAGDAFAAGLIYGTLGGMSPPQALEFGAAAACLKLTMAGDFLLATAREVGELASGTTTGGIRR